MKKVVVLASFVLFSVATFAQAPLAKGEKQLNAGVGFSGWGIPLYVGMDYGIHPDITIGGELSFRSHSEKIVGKTYSSTILGISGNGNYHFNRILEIPSNFDFYAGLTLGFYIWSTPSDYPGSGSSDLGWGAQLGGRYFFKNNLGLNLELGGGNVLGGKFGITYLF